MSIGIERGGQVVEMHRVEARRIKAASQKMRDSGFLEIAKRYLDLALSHELAASRIIRVSQNAEKGASGV